MQNKAVNNFKFSQPCGGVKYNPMPGKRSGTAPSRSNAKATAPPVYETKQERIKKANEFLRIMSKVKMS